MNFNEIWKSALEKLRGSPRISGSEFELRLAGTRVRESNDGVLHIVAPSIFDSFLIADNYKDDIADALFHAAGMDVPFEIIAPEEQSSGVLADENASAPRVASFPRAVVPAVPAPLPEAVRPPAIDSRFTFDNFIIGPQNDMAFSAAMNVAANPKESVYNPIFIFGPTGVGKTHLIHAIANKIFADRAAKGLPAYKIVYVTSEEFVNSYMSALQSHEQNAILGFRRRYREADVLLIDDIQFFAGKTSTQEAFFHTFNELLSRRSQIILTSDRPAGDIVGLEDRLISRFQSGLSVDIQPPSFETRLAILRRKAESRNFDYERYKGILEFVAENISHSVRDLEGAVNTLAAYVNVRKPETLSTETVETLLQSLIIKNHTNRITAEAIQHRVAEHYKVPEAKMRARDRTAPVALARQVAMYLCSELTDMKLIAIGEFFGGRDHGTVIHAKRTIKNRMETEADTKRDVEYLKKQLAGYRS